MTGKTIEGAVAAAVDCVNRNIDTSQPVEIEAVCAWAVGAAFRYMRGEVEPTGDKQKIISPEPKRNGFDRTEARQKSAFMAEAAKAAGMTGDMCSTCLNYTMTRNGTCLRCLTCGSTTGCS